MNMGWERILHLEIYNNFKNLSFIFICKFQFFWVEHCDINPHICEKNTPYHT